MEERKGVKAIIFTKVSKNLYFLILHRRLNWTGWELLKGGIEKGESYKEALIREIKEETGIEEVNIIKEVGKIEFIANNKKLSYKCFLIETKMCDVKLDKREHNSYKWANYEEALNLLTHDTDKNMLKNV